MQVSGLRAPVVSARIQHGLSETIFGFGPPRARLACGGRRRPRLRTSAARKLEGALVVAVFAGQTMQVHPRYIRALTCTYTPSRIPACAVGGARTGRTRAGRPGDARTPGLAAVAPTRRRYGPDCPYPAPRCRHAGSPGCRLRVRPRDAAVHALVAEGFGSMSMRSASMPSPVAARTAAASSCSVSQRFVAAGVSESRIARNIARLTSCPRM
jgi:hypothetical protein